MLALQVITPGDKTYPTMNGQRLHFHSQAWHQSPGILKEKITRTLLQDNLGVADPSLEEEDEHTSWHIYLTDLPWGYQTHIQEFILVPAWPIYCILYPEGSAVPSNNTHTFTPKCHPSNHTKEVISCSPKWSWCICSDSLHDVGGSHNSFDGRNYLTECYMQHNSETFSLVFFFCIFLVSLDAPLLLLTVQPCLSFLLVFTASSSPSTLLPAIKCQPWNVKDRGRKR